MNALAAVAIGRLLHVPEPMIADSLNNAQITGMRMEKIVTQEGWTLLNDSYNASPTAMKAAVKVLSSMREVGRSLTSEDIDELLTYGQLGIEIANGAREHIAEQHVRSYQDKQELRQALLQLVNPRDTVLVKASRGMKLEDVVKEWIASAH